MADPLRNFRFKLEIDGIIRAGFTEASGFDTTTDVIEYREGTDPAHPRKFPGMTKYGDITLKWGLGDDMELYQMRQDIIDGKITRRTVSIVVLDETGTEKARWQCLNAFARRPPGSSMNALHKPASPRRRRRARRSSRSTPASAST